MTLFLKQPKFDKLTVELSIVLGNLRDSEIFEIIPSEELVKVFPGSAWMIGNEGVSDILTSQIQERSIPARVILNPARDIVNLTLDRDPQIPWFVVIFELLAGNVLLILLTLHSGSKHKPKNNLKNKQEKNIYIDNNKRSTNPNQECPFERFS